MLFTFPDRTPAQQALAAIEDNAVADLTRQIEAYNARLALVYDNAAATPQEIFDAMGAAAASVVVKSVAARDYLTAHRTDAHPPLTAAPASLRFNGDGSVTVLSRLSVESAGGATVTLKRAGALVATVTNPTTGDVERDRLSVFPGLTEGTYDLAATLDGYTIPPLSVLVTRDSVVSMQVIAPEPEN